MGQIATASVSVAKPLEATGSPKVKASLKRFDCESLRTRSIADSSLPTKHHTVTLSWNASAHSPDPAAGYCLYKSETKIDPKDSACSSCEPVTPTPIPATSCVDDIVKDGVTYYYVVRAVDKAGNTSAWSNVATVPILASDPVKSSSVSSPPALCRVPPNRK